MCDEVTGKAGMSTIIKEFSRFAHEYDRHNMIQAEVAKKLIAKLPKSGYHTILDLGAGSGEVAKNLSKAEVAYTHLTVFDSSAEMLAIHPSSEKIVKVEGDFNTKDFISDLPLARYELILSSSALQWSRDLDHTLGELSVLSNSLHAAIFTANTFQTLHQTANIDSPIYTAAHLQQKIENHYAHVHFELHSYRLHFDSVREMFRYIKKSGVSSGEKKLSYKETRSLMKKYPLDYLEFEVLFVEAKR